MVELEVNEEYFGLCFNNKTSMNVIIKTEQIYFMNTLLTSTVKENVTTNSNKSIENIEVLNFDSLGFAHGNSYVYNYRNGEKVAESVANHYHGVHLNGHSRDIKQGFTYLYDYPEEKLKDVFILRNDTVWVNFKNLDTLGIYWGIDHPIYGDCYYGGIHETINEAIKNKNELLFPLKGYFAHCGGGGGDKIWLH